ncbi:aldehyde dehydrogenase family protein [Shewanella algicola]|jgi:aldehyde dehydrogenase (NAD+)|uniref:Aldehyde dehydrogenase family protein n=1 Tax=Shewanella algicola TaxID=640633 RepID=A0A9X1Z8E9_9GAMM|nr:aldehyde dehydrogenase family protein [Shewanella algicola]MCL1107703.1 aldehyde dehydrogenase family protein [Shewanella algicola]GGP72037.1 aldehyde dehydrogenase [Shewanella algicola]|tara:strand:+ start:427 stop:1917 length:1491 start_codon:yes stop_codon:yes gene_type:complete
MYNLGTKYMPQDEYGLFIGGQWVNGSSSNTYESINPATGKVFTQITLANSVDVDKAVDAAQKAFLEWKNTSTIERQNILLKIADKIQEKKDFFSSLEAMETGKPIRETSSIDIPLAIDHFRYFAGVIRSHSDEAVMINDETMSLVLSEPLGVVGQVIPWNYPLLMAAWKIAPAIAAGNTVVIKPSEMTSSTLLELCKIFEQTLPAGVVNVITGTGQDAGQSLLDHPGINKLAFTGSTNVGYAVAKAAANKLIPVTLELGGKSANIIFEDANWERALDGAALSILLNQGQVCESGARLFVQDTIFERFVGELKSKFEAVKVGDPMDPATQMGTQVSKTQMDRILGYIELAREEGATILTGGKQIIDRNLENGCFIEPTIVIDANNSMRVSQEEIFGPVVIVIPFSTEDEVISAANESEYGLAGGVWTQDINRALRVARGVETGRMWVNTYHELPAHAPFGGYKKSGIGRETHKSIMDAYTQKKNILISLNEKPMGMY